MSENQKPTLVGVPFLEDGKIKFVEKQDGPNGSEVYVTKMWGAQTEPVVLEVESTEVWSLQENWIKE